MPRGVPRIPEPWEFQRSKRCKACGESKPYADFAPERRFTDGTIRYHRPYCHRCDSRMVMERRARNPRTEEQRERARAYHREWKRQRREALRRERAIQQAVDATPLRSLVLDREHNFDSHREMAAILGLDPTTLARLLNGRHERVSLATADRVCVRLGAHLYDMYPELMEVA